jgi:hypothetical protein
MERSGLSCVVMRKDNGEGNGGRQDSRKNEWQCRLNVEAQSEGPFAGTVDERGTTIYGSSWRDAGRI